jgi:hypothetical protein
MNSKRPSSTQRPVAFVPSHLEAAEEPKSEPPAPTPPQAKAPAAEGPTITSFELTTMVFRNDLVTAITAQCDGGAHAIKAAEIFASKKTEPGKGAPLKPLDKSFDSSKEWVVGSISEPLDPDQPIYIRAKDDRDVWGPVVSKKVWREL